MATCKSYNTDLKKVSRIQQKFKDTVNAFVNEIQCILPSDNIYYNIVDLIKHLILLYWHNIFESNLLSTEEADKLLQLFADNDKAIADYQWDLIYESTKEGIKRDIFIGKIYDKPNILLLIKLKEENTIIGGYTKAGWIEAKSHSAGWSSDKDAFVFYLQSSHKFEPFIANVRQGDKLIDHALGYSSNYYGMFGHCWIFYFQDDNFNQQDHHWEGGSIESQISGNYEEFKHEQMVLSGHSHEPSHDRTQYEIEVFQILE